MGFDTFKTSEITCKYFTLLNRYGPDLHAWWCGKKAHKCLPIPIVQKYVSSCNWMETIYSRKLNVFFSFPGGTPKTDPRNLLGRLN